MKHDHAAARKAITSKAESIWPGNHRAAEYGREFGGDGVLHFDVLDSNGGAIDGCCVGYAAYRLSDGAVSVRAKL